MSLAALKAELTTDPLTRGYASMSDLEASTSLNNPDRQVDPVSLPTSLILAGMKFTEYAALTADQKQYLGFLFNRDDVDIRNGTETRVALLAMFANGSQTRTNILARMTQMLSRADELGLGFVRVGEVTMARGM